MFRAEMSPMTVFISSTKTGSPDKTQRHHWRPKRKYRK